jgi:hypothetical protein
VFRNVMKIIRMVPIKSPELLKAARME